jgi:hypothetical protein
MNAAVAIMDDRFKACAIALETVALLVALSGACAAQTLQPSEQAPQSPSEPPRFLYIHCATAGGDGPCALDPAMQRLDGSPQRDGPREMPAPRPLIRPDIAPAR